MGICNGMYFLLVLVLVTVQPGTWCYVYKYMYVFHLVEFWWLCQASISLAVKDGESQFIP